MSRHLFSLPVGLMLLLGTFPCRAQQTPAADDTKIEFEVATVKPWNIDANAMANGMVSGGSCHGVDKNYTPGAMAPPPLGRCVILHASFNQLVRIAYRTLADGGPAWTESDLFNVEGKADDPETTTEAQLLSMLRTLLQKQFKLEIHHEVRQVQGFSLFVGKGGSKLKESRASEADTPSQVNFKGSTYTAQHVTMDEFARSIRGISGGPVTDKTGLTGRYDISFEWDRTDTGSFLSNMAAELGLRLETMKVPVEYIVVDHAEKPLQQ